MFDLTMDRYRINLPAGETDEKYAKYCTTMKSVQGNMETWLLNESINETKENSKKIWGFGLHCYILKKKKLD